MKKLKLNYGADTTTLFELDFIKGLSPVKDEVVVLVPEQFKADTEEYLIKHLGRHGLFHVSVYGLGKLLEEFSSGFGLPKSSLSKFGKSLMLTRILKDLRPELEIYRTKLSRGLADNLVSTLDGLRLEGIEAGELEALASRLMPGQSLLIKKLREMALILKRYEEGISSAHTDDIALTEALIEALLEKKALKNLHLIVEGFNGMSRQEMRLVAALSHYAGGSTFINILKSNEGVLKTYSDKFVDGLKQAFYDLGDWDFQIEEISAEESACNHRAFLFSNIFSHNRKRFSVEGMELIECDNREDELEYIALDILKRMREEGRKWSDFALITNSIDLYQKHIYKVLGDYRIPYFIDDKAGVVDLSFCAFLVSALESIKSAFSRRPVMRLLKHYSHLELPGLSCSISDYQKIYEARQKAYFNAYSKFEIYARKYSIDRDMFFHKQYLDFFFSSFEGEEKEGHTGLLDSTDLKSSYYSLMKKLTSFSRRLKEAEGYREMLTSLKTFIEEIGLLERLKKLKTLYQNLYDEDKSRSLQAQESSLEELLNQLEMLGSLELSGYTEFIDLVISALEDYDISLPPPAEETIVLGTAERSRLIGVKQLYLIGCNEGHLPSQTPSNVFFSENEMMKLAEHSFGALKRSKNFMDKEVFDIFEKIAFAEQGVYFTYTAHDENSEEIGPSYWLRSLEKQGNLSIKKIPPPSIVEVGAAGIAEKYLDSLLLEHRGLMSTKTFEGLHLSPDTERLLSSYLETYRSSKRDLRAELNSINSESFKAVFQNISVSKMESHAGCPYSFFVNYILCPKEMPEEKLDKRSYGSMMHRVLEHFVSAYVGAEDGEAFKKEGLNIFYQLLDKEMAEDANYKYNKVERRKLELAKSYFSFLVPMLIKHFDTGYLKDVSCEHEIREKEAEFELRGKVDRVDVFEIAGERYFRVIDYKSGDRGFDAERFSHGVQIQLPLYLSYFVKGRSKWGEGRPLGFAYSSLEEKIERLKPEDGYDEDRVRQNYRLSGKFIKDVSIISCMEPSILEERKSSLVQSLELVKKENEFHKGRMGSLMSAEAFEELFSSLNALVAKLSDSLSSANIEIRPCKIKQYEPCSYCRYKNICKFDGLRYKSRYRTESLVPVPDVKR